MPELPPVIAVNAIRKTYGATVALDGASLTVGAGTVHALLGENGAGKSTMVKILSGLVQPDSGEIRICGAVRRLGSPSAAQACGLQTAFQEMTQVRDLTVTQNLLLTAEPTRFGFLRKREAESLAVAHLETLGLGFIDPRAEVRDLDLPVRQKLEIARAIFKRPKLLLLDEPTSTLSGRDIDWLGGIIADTKAGGAAVIFISHRLPEVNEFCEFLTVFRNGKDAGTARVGDLPEEEIVRMIIGRSLSATFPPRENTVRADETPRLAARGLSTGGRLHQASFDLAPGEVLGVSGLQGMGMQELFLGCFGAVPLDDGHVEINGKRVTLLSPRDAVKANIGVSLVPEDRKTEGLFLKLDGLKNMSLPVLGRFTRFGLIDEEAEADAVGEAMRAVQVDSRAIYTRAGAFSGGNQQKIAIGKWLMTGSRVLLLYDPTRGVDVGTKHEIYVLIHEFAKAGGSVLLFSSEIPELVNLCHRVLVMYKGSVVLELDGDELDEETIIRAALGEKSHAVAARARGMGAMTISIAETARPRHKLNLSRHRGLIAALIVFGALLGFVAAISPNGLGYYDIASLVTSGAPLALAAIGQTFIIVTGGFDLSAGAAISLVNSVVATIPQETAAGQIGAVAAGLAIGMAIGAFNGFFVAFLRMQSIVVTLATMFLVRGVTLLIMPDPGGAVAATLTKLFTGTAIPGVLPAAAIVIAAGLAVWLVVRRVRFGTAMFAVGSDPEAAHAVGISVEWTRFGAFVLGGLLYGAAGVFISAETGSADPLVGDPLLLQSFTAVVLGGTLLGGGRGSAAGSVVGAFTLMLMVNILLALDVSAYYSTIAEGVVLVLAVVVSSVGSGSVAVQSVRRAGLWFGARGSGLLARQVATGIAAPVAKTRGKPTPRASWLDRNREQLRFVLPAYIAFALVVIATQFAYSGNIVFSLKYYNSLVVLGAFLAILALGQGSVILAGGLDLSVPWTIGFCGILSAGLIQGSNEATVWVVPLTLGIGVLIGMVNGVGVASLGLPPIVVTLATNGVMQGVALLYSNGTPSGFASPALRWLMTGAVAGVTPIVGLMALFILSGVTLLGRTVFGRWIYAVGNSPRAAFLSGADVKATTIGVYALSGFCAALVGILITGFSGQASLGMGDDYLLPSIAVVIVGGTLITGGRGNYIGMLGGVLLLTALQTLLAGTILPHSVRDIIYGAVVLASVLALREK